jgi:hypothetical protein
LASEKAQLVMWLWKTSQRCFSQFCRRDDIFLPLWCPILRFLNNMSPLLASLQLSVGPENLFSVLTSGVLRSGAVLASPGRCLVPCHLPALRRSARCVTLGWTRSSRPANIDSVSSGGRPTLSCASVLTIPRTIRRPSASSRKARNGSGKSLRACRTPG